MRAPLPVLARSVQEGEGRDAIEVSAIEDLDVLVSMYCKVSHLHLIGPLS